MTLEADLRKAIGDRHVPVDRPVTASYETPWTRRFTGRARCVVRPAATDRSPPPVPLLSEVLFPFLTLTPSRLVLSNNEPVDWLLVSGPR